MKRATWLGAAFALALIAAGTAVLLWPLDGPGQSGSAVAPHYDPRLAIEYAMLHGHGQSDAMQAVGSRRALAIVLFAVAVGIAVTLACVWVRRRTLRAGLLAAVPVLVAVALVLLWPFTKDGVTGSALLPTYHAVGWASFTNQPLPHFTPPQVFVDRRRHIAEIVALVGVLAVTLASWLAARRVQPR